jgi:hypothetical protein
MLRPIGVFLAAILRHKAVMRPFRLAVMFLIALASGTAAVASTAAPPAQVAEEAVAEALKLPSGYKRDVVLRAVSRNLRWFGQHGAGVRAAGAMTDGGAREVPPGSPPAQPRFVPIREAMPPASPCDTGIWRQEDGGEARTPAARNAWAEECLLTRDFHWIGLPAVEQVRAIAAGVPAGDVKAGVLAMLIRSYGDRETLRFVSDVMGREGDRLPPQGREALRQMLGEPSVLYRLGRANDALAAARSATTFQSRAAPPRGRRCRVGDRRLGNACRDAAGIWRKLLRLVQSCQRLEAR